MGSYFTPCWDILDRERELADEGELNFYQSFLQRVTLDSNLHAEY